MIDQGKQPNPGSPSPPDASTETLKQQGRETVHEVSEAAQHQAEGYFNQQRDYAAEQSHKLTSVLQKWLTSLITSSSPFL
ncbi:hypothetical protein HORIV_11640 [Vreelandella olivaria]|uniref:Uncharacterized protein n=1 Tax=Vreelandella olivaria TaxID=390919 RepID=A0ABM7GE43_9GAMM|nr:hypothetical protein HORIV_11640 [Halomonas olivaria]